MTNAYNMTTWETAAVALSPTIPITTYTAFASDAYSHLIPWIVVIAAVVFCDLVFGLCRAYCKRERTRFSTACRKTIVKLILYNSLLLSTGAFDQATEYAYSVTQWLVIVVCVYEGSSVVANFLKLHGIDIDFNAVISLIIRKKFGLDRSDLDGIVTSSSDNQGPAKMAANASGGDKSNNNGNN